MVLKLLNKIKLSIRNLSYNARVFSVFLTIQEVMLPVKTLGGYIFAIMTVNA